ncbi:MAG: hypothetical protein NT049_11945, partial [Planctomycetota bacterium]|nr:hypothetical protein [Planctomycetota bacterium]
GFWGIKFDVSVFAKVALTFDCQNGSQKRVWRGKYFQKNSSTVNEGGIRDSGFGQQRAASKLAG